jgi:TetR/AcrR family transcriptional regulator, regulator of cefoperazone and chloramphenicol sensitivity
MVLVKRFMHMLHGSVMDTTDDIDTEKRLLLAAGELFADKGFEGASVREICQRAKVSNIAAVNYYFRDKERLYIEAVKSACLRQAEAFPLPNWQPGTSPQVKLREFIKVLVDRMLGEGTPPWARQLFLRELAHPTAACTEFVQSIIRPNAEILGRILSELLPKVPERKRRLIAFSIVGQCFFHRFAQPIVAQLVGEEEARNYGSALLAEHITEFSFAALGLNPTKKTGTPRSRVRFSFRNED